jgi:hypothetical protein
MESGYFTIFDFLTRSTFAAWRQPVICVIKRDFPVAATCAFVGSFSGFLSDDMNIDIVHIIDERSKEIYRFKYGSNSWIYSGITYSFRNDRKDVWGEDWSEYYKNDLDKELNRWALKTFQEEFNDLSMF